MHKAVKALDDACLNLLEQMSVTDPMHLGTAKHIIFKNVLIKKGLISNPDFLVIQQRIDSMQVPRFVGRIPYKFASGFTADQFKSWTKYTNLFTLHTTNRTF